MQKPCKGHRREGVRVGDGKLGSTDGLFSKIEDYKAEIGVGMAPLDASSHSLSPKQGVIQREATVLTTPFQDHGFHQDLAIENPCTTLFLLKTMQKPLFS